MKISFLFKWIIKSCLITVFLVPIRLHSWVQKRRRSKLLSSGKNSEYYKNKITYFDRGFLDPTADAGARAMSDVLKFLDDTHTEVGTLVFGAGSAEAPNKKTNDTMQIVKFSFVQIREMRRSLLQCDYILVMSPENYFVLSIALLFCKKSPVIWFFGGDVYYERFKTGMKNHSGLVYLRYLLNYMFYRVVEPMLWSSADVCLSPNQGEADLIRSFNPHSFVLPIRAFSNAELENRDYNSHLDNSKRIDFIFVGGTGHSPNIAALKCAVTEILPEIKKRYDQDVILHIIGSGWEEEEFASWMGNASNCVMYGRVSENELIRLYAESTFALALIQDGAGVKGKVIEAMYHGAIVITTPIGAQGIPESVLPRFTQTADMYSYIDLMIDDLDAQRTTKSSYVCFLHDFYSISVYEELFDMLLSKAEY